MEWYANNTTLADILGMLPCLAVFVWETGRYVVLSWEHLSSNFRSAIVKLFQRPSLTTVVMKLPDGFPLCSLHHSPIKRLEISHIGFLDNHQGQLMLPHLEMLKILPGRCGNLGQMQLHVPSLQHISFCDPHDDGPEACALIQMAINTSARSLKRLWWSYDCSIPRCMYSCNLESATMIKFLTFDSLARSNQLERTFQSTLFNHHDLPILLPNPLSRLGTKFSDCRHLQGHFDPADVERADNCNLNFAHQF